MVKTSSRFEVVAFGLASLFGLGSALAAWRLRPETAFMLIREDGVVESLSAIFYAMGMVVCLVAVGKRRHTPYAWMWLVLCLVCLGEETSWFQRIIGYSVPGVQRMNAQSEFNLHNLKILHGGEVLDPQGHIRVSWHSLLNSQALFTLGLAGYFLALPALAAVRWGGELLDRLAYPRPEGRFVIAMWTTLTLSFALALISSGVTKQAIAETREMLCAFFIFLYALVFLAEAPPPAADPGAP